MVALRYQVDSRARRAKFGNSSSSILPSPSVSVVSGSSSKTTCTIGVVERAGPATAPPASLGNSRPRTGETTRNSSSTTTGATESTVRNERSAAARAYRTAAPAPTSSATNTETDEPPSRSPSGGSTSAATSSPTSTSMAPHPTAGRIRPRPHTTPAATNGGTSV